jgi:hypothetical protein
MDNFGLDVLRNIALYLKDDCRDMVALKIACKTFYKALNEKSFLYRYFDVHRHILYKPGDYDKNIFEHKMATVENPDISKLANGMLSVRFYAGYFYVTEVEIIEKKCTAVLQFSQEALKLLQHKRVLGINTDCVQKTRLGYSRGVRLNCVELVDSKLQKIIFSPNCVKPGDRVMLEIRRIFSNIEIEQVSLGSTIQSVVIFNKYTKNAYGRCPKNKCVVF